MIFVLSKVVNFFALPSNALIMMCVLGLVLLVLTPLRRTATWLLGVGLGLYLVFGLSPASNFLVLPLTERFPAWKPDGRAPDGIIVLGGAINAEATVYRGSLELDQSGERIIEMLKLARQYPSARIVFTGGSGNLIARLVPEAPIVGQLLEDFGVAKDRIILESKSRTTAENAEFTKQLVSPKPGERWLLITSAFHMPRSIGSFRKVGFDVEAYPVDWRSQGWEDAFDPFDKMSAGLSRADTAIHEWTGLIGYWLAGLTSELFPGPRQPSACKGAKTAEACKRD
ncbi:YdcF family protein [Bradyrhizobium sp. SYSU BS000235]|uniref:YdcF family protein n=1 Tax=Bradyrhizobium sp. SYSU BS000235 TaxID=3411332 RepID=UPI003C782A5D